MSALGKLATLLILGVVAATGQFLIKKGLTKIGPFGLHEIFSNFTLIATNPYILAAAFLYSAAVLLYFSLLSRSELSTIYPVAVALNFMLVSLASHLLLGETLSLLKISGFVFIILGVSCVFYARL